MRYRQFAMKGGRERALECKTTPCTVEMGVLRTLQHCHTMWRMSRKNTPPPDPAEKVPLKERLPPEKLVPVTWLGSTAGAEDVDTAKVRQIGDLLWYAAGKSRAEHDAMLIQAIDLFESIKPADGVEAMLAAQMVGAHHAIVECLRRAMLDGQTFEGRNANLANAQKLMTLYTQQMAALDKHRGKGQQKVTVEHVHVESGGQAIVGNVQAPQAPQDPPRSTPPPPRALEAPAQPPPSDFTTKRVRSPVARQK